MVLSAIVTTGFGVMTLGFGVSMTAGWPPQGALAVMAACLGAIAFCRRITGARVVLDQQGVIIVNPVFTYEIPYRYVSKVESDRRGSLVITTREAVEIRPLGFAGSIIDHFVGSTETAVAKIKAALAERRDLRGSSHPVRRFTRPWVADACAIGTVVCVVLALVVRP
ncbi:hypothetical protein [Streptomyces sp. NBC_01006]|uniref:hypothetical protein n=1 Tax=Streptomyces sp. NBC_01006 TaxID=2903716 RepID=UPI00386B3F40|nr:hypothetical protein OG509_09725 [Streptomyces sp. NBC_01006]